MCHRIFTSFSFLLNTAFFSAVAAVVQSFQTKSWIKVRIVLCFGFALLVRCKNNWNCIYTICSWCICIYVQFPSAVDSSVFVLVSLAAFFFVKFLHSMASCICERECTTNVTHHKDMKEKLLNLNYASHKLLITFLSAIYSVRRT